MDESIDLKKILQRIKKRPTDKAYRPAAPARGGIKLYVKTKLLNPPALPEP
jgi:hypothetical protein